MIELLWPSRCLGCDIAGEGSLCPRCWPEALCVLERPPEGCARAWAAGQYGGPLGRALRHAKFAPDRRAGLVLADVLSSLTAGLDPPDVVVPAPSTPWSRIRRGFGTGDLLASRVGRALGAPVVRALFLRGGRRQSRMGRRERRSNLVGRVGVRRTVGGRALLVDDVVTTGATAAACARELLCTGVHEVSLLALCTALPLPVSGSDDTPRSPFRI